MSNIKFKHVFLLFFLSILSVTTFAQRNHKTKRVPFYKTYNHRTLTNSLTKNIDNDSLKVIEIYNWVTNHINYKHKKRHSQNSKYHKPNKTLKRRRGISEHISYLFHIMCKDAGIESKLISGYSRETSFYNEVNPPWTNHIWNTVHLESGWHLMDPTRGTGDIIEYRIKQRIIPYLLLRKSKFRIKIKQSSPTSNYCFIDPKKLIKSNLPIIPDFQFLTPQIDLATWANGTDSTNLFFQQNTPSISNNTSYNIDDAHLNHYFLKLGQKGLNFNTKNHRDIAIPSTHISNQLFKYYRKHLSKKTDYKIQQKHLDTTSYYLEIARLSGKKFKSENSSHHATIVKLNNTRHKTLSKSAKGKYGYYKTRIREVKELQKFYSTRAGRSENSVYRLIAKHSNKTNDDLSRIKKGLKADSLASIKKYNDYKFKLDSINKVISIYDDTIKTYLDSISLGQKKLKEKDLELTQLLTNFVEKINTSSLKNGRQLSNKTLFIQNSEVHNIHLQVKNCQKERDKIYKKDIYPYISKVRTKVNKMTRSHTAAKKIIQRIKSSTSIYLNENSLYEKQNKKYQRTLSFLEESIFRLRNVAITNSNLYKKERVTCKSIGKLLAYNIALENSRYHFIIEWHDKEYKSNNTAITNLLSNNKYTKLYIKKRQQQLKKLIKGSKRRK